LVVALCAALWRCVRACGGTGQLHLHYVLAHLMLIFLRTYVVRCAVQGEPKSSATGSSARELDLPGQLRSMEVQDWAQYLAGGLNAPDLISRVALLPQVRDGGMCVCASLLL
jgi:hypothetical protein